MQMEFTVEIETFDKSLEFSLLESNQLSVMETEKTIAEGISIKYNFTVICKASGIPDAISISLIVGEHVILPIALDIISNYLYDKLKDRKVETLRISGNEVG